MGHDGAEVRDEPRGEPHRRRPAWSRILETFDADGGNSDTGDPQGLDSSLDSSTYSFSKLDDPWSVEGTDPWATYKVAATPTRKNKVHEEQEPDDWRDGGTDGNRRHWSKPGFSWCANTAPSRKSDISRDSGWTPWGRDGWSSSDQWKKSSWRRGGWGERREDEAQRDGLESWWNSGKASNGTEGVVARATETASHFCITDEKDDGGGRGPTTMPDILPGDRDGLTLSERERAIQRWIDGEAEQVPRRIAGPRVLRTLYGTAALVCSHLLRGSTLTQELEDMRGDAVQKEFIAMRRMSGESFDSFLARAAWFRCEMLKHDKKFQMGERYYVGFLLVNAEITNRDRAMVMGSANNVMREAPIAMALRRIWVPTWQAGCPLDSRSTRGRFCRAPLWSRSRVRAFSASRTMRWLRI